MMRFTSCLVHLQVLPQQFTNLIHSPPDRISTLFPVDVDCNELGEMKCTYILNRFVIGSKVKLSLQLKFMTCHFYNGWSFHRSDMIVCLSDLSCY